MPATHDRCGSLCSPHPTQQLGFTVDCRVFTARYELQAYVVDVWDETKNARTLTLRPGWNWRTHRASQYIRVGVSIYIANTY